MKKWSNNSIQTTCTSSYYEEIHAKFQNDGYKTVRGFALIKDTHGMYIEDEKWLSLQCGKSKKHDLTIITKPHAHPHTIKKTHAMFQNDRHKAVRGVAHTRGTHYLYTEGEKWLSKQCGKSDKIWSNNYIQPTCTTLYHKENTCKVLKWLELNCRRSCTHKTPRVNVDGWTNGRKEEQTNWRKPARLSWPAKAGVTKTIHLG